jgi:ATP-dependent helicase HrpB
MVAEAAKTGQGQAAAELAVLLTERGLGGPSADLDRRLDNFRRDRSPRAEQARGLAKRLAASVPEKKLPPPRTPPRKGEGGVDVSESPSPLRGGVRGGGEKVSAGPLLLHAWPDRVAKQRGAAGRYVLANGRGAMVDETDPLAKAEFLVVADLQGKAQNARIVGAAEIAEDDIRDLLADRLERKTESVFDPARGTVRVRESLRLGAIQLKEHMLPAPTGDEADKAMLDAVHAYGLTVLPWDKASETLRKRLGWLHRGLGAPWPDMSDEALVEKLHDWLGPFLHGEAAMSRLRSGLLSDALMSAVPYDLQRKVDDLAPTHFHAPTGNNLPIRYDDDWPVLAIRVQELFGLDQHPSIASGTVPLTLELLSPAHRPIQTTRDLPGFWRGSWADVRSDMRGRYPRHVWPEDPRLAQATARAKPRGT